MPRMSGTHGADVSNSSVNSDELARIRKALEILIDQEVSTEDATESGDSS